MNTNIEKFNPREHLMQIKSGRGENAKSSDYLAVQWRLVWFRTEFPEGSIETEVVMIDLDRVVEAEVFVWNAEKRHSDKVLKSGKGIAIFKATVKTGQGGSASATGSESAVDFGDFIEKAETKAIGRALAALGFGTQFAPELNEGERIVDAPVEKPKSQPKPQAKSQNQTPPRQLLPAVKLDVIKEEAPVTPQTGIPTVAELQAQCVTLFGPNKWKALLARILPEAQDDNLDEAQRRSVKRNFDNVVARRAAQPQAS
jgi:hypothetical protein